MINLKVYGGDTFEFHKKVVDSKNKPKNDPNYKTRLLNLNSNIETLFFDYEAHFNKNTLELLNSFLFNSAQKDDLIKLYNYKNSVIQQLKIDITTTEKNRIINTCQNCTINEINSFDHLVPKTDFVEFVVNPQNLFPSCTQCNSYKSSVWLQNKKRAFLNLYLDQLPSLQYLFVNITFKANDPIPTFYLKNINGIDKDTYNLIYYHYEKLELLRRFKENSSDVITGLCNTIKPFLKIASLKDIKDSIIEKSKEDRIYWGYNYWKSILELELINNAGFINRFK